MINTTVETSQGSPTVEDSINTDDRSKTQSSSRPSHFLTRTSTISSTPESTTQSLKVSQSNIKFRPRSRTEFQTTETSDLLEPSVRSSTSGRRGISRFRYQSTESQDTSNEEQSVSSLSPKRRIISTTQRVFDENRSYRPSELADLSSLTSVDFGKLQEFNDFDNRRRRKPTRILVTSTTSTTTEEPEKSVKTSSRTLPLARKLISTAAFGKSKRTFDARNRTNFEETDTISIREQPESGKNTTTRPRRIIRRYRTTTEAPTLHDQEPKETRTVLDLFSQNITEPKTILFKPKQVQLFPLNENKDDDTDDSFEDNINEEEENIKLSESNIRENSEFNTFESNDGKLHKLSGQKSGNTYRGLSFKEQHRSGFTENVPFTPEGGKVSVSSTEPNVAVRTRKIIRKILPSDARNTLDVINESDGLVGRKRKIIRKLRPVQKFYDIVNTETQGSFASSVAEEDKIEHYTSTEKLKNDRIPSRRYLHSRFNTADNSTSTDQDETGDSRIFRLRLNSSGNVTNQEEVVSERSNTDENTNNKDTLNRNRYILRTRTDRIKNETKNNNVATLEHTTVSSDISGNTTFNLDTSSIPSGSESNETFIQTNDTLDEPKDYGIDSLISPETKLNEIELKKSVPSTVLENDENPTESDLPTTTDDLTESTSERQETSSTPSTVSTESFLKRFNSRRTEYKPKFNRIPTLTSTEASDSRTSLKYKAFSRKPYIASTTEARRNVDERQPSYSNRSRFNRYRSKTTVTDSSRTTETAILTNEENVNNLVVPNQIAIPTNETSQSGEARITTESITVEPTTDGRIPTQETTILTNEDITLNMANTEAQTISEDITFTTEFVEVSTSPSNDNDTVVPVQSITSTNEIAESPTQLLPKTTEGIVMPNETTEDLLYTTTESFTTEENTRESRTTTSTTTQASILSTTSSKDGSTTLSKFKLPSYRLKSKQYQNQLTTDKETSTPSYRRFNKFSDRSSTTQRSIFSKPKYQNSFTKYPIGKTIYTSSERPINKLLYKPRTNKNNIVDDKDEDDETAAEDQENEYDGEDEEKTDVKDFDKEEDDRNVKVVNRPVFAKKPLDKIVNTPFVPKIAESSSNKELEDIDTAAIKLRNKNLFAKHRKMNVPFIPTVQTSTAEGITIETTQLNQSPEEDTTLSAVEASTQTNEEQSVTTEYLTTLHHVFSDVDDTMKTTTEESNNVINTTANKIERLVEVNRIVNVKTKEDEANSTLDKIGEVNRITVIKVVDTNGKFVNATDVSELQVRPLSPVYTPETTNHPHEPIKSSVDAIIEIAKVQEIPAKVVMGKVNLTNVLLEITQNNTVPVKAFREDRKFEIFGGSKISNFNLGNKEPYYGKAEIIDGRSHINIITPRPAYHTEASTIALEGLFLTKKPETNSDNHEVLETEHSRFVNVRVLHPDESVRLEKAPKDNSKMIPIKLLKQDDEEVTMKAKVVEVKAIRSADMIKISPIKIEMFKTASKNMPIYRIEKQNTSPT